MDLPVHVAAFWGLGTAEHNCARTTVEMDFADTTHNILEAGAVYGPFERVIGDCFQTAMAMS